MPSSPSEGSISRGRREAIASLKTIPFWLTEIVVGPLVGIAASTQAPADASSTVTTLVGFGGGLAGALGVAVAIFFWHVFRAPYKQRDEARAELLRLTDSDDGEAARKQALLVEVHRNRQETVQRWRQYVETYRIAPHGRIPAQSWYREVRRFMSGEAIRSLESEMITITVGGYSTTDIDRILDEIARIEKEWGLL